MRELHFAVERAGLLAEGEMIDVPTCRRRSWRRRGRSAWTAAPAAACPAAVGAGGTTDGDGDEGPDPARVRAALEQAKWRREKAAEILGVSPRTLYRWIKKLGL